MYKGKIEHTKKKAKKKKKSLKTATSNDIAISLYQNDTESNREKKPFLI